MMNELIQKLSLKFAACRVPVAKGPFKYDISALGGDGGKTNTDI